MEDKKIKEPETIVVSIDENYGDSCINDAVNNVNAKSRKPKGFVEIYSIDEHGKKQKVGKSNLVLYKGREWIASRLCNKINDDINQVPSEFISWFGLGNGGAPTSAPLAPATPTNDLDSLSNEIPFHASDSSCADLRSGQYYKHPFDTIEFQKDSLNEDSWLILKITTTISVDHANGYNLNEAGLYTSTSNVGGHGGPFNIFSIVTFPSIVKDDTRQLVFYWYLYC
jgi:hypothetical protein